MKKVVCFLILVALMIVSTYVYAAPGASMSLTANPTSLKEGQEVTITLNLNNVTDIEKGIFACTGVLEYDKTIFEVDPEPSKAYTDASEWMGGFNPSNSNFAATIGSMTATEGKRKGVIGTFKLKTKTSITSKSTTISLKNIKVVDDNDNDVSVPNASVTLNVTGTSNNGENTGAGNGSGSNAGTSAGSNNGGSSSNSGQGTSQTPASTTKPSVDKTTSGNQLPKTGVNNYVVIGIAAVAVIAVISIIRYKNIIK